jgi:hypothetical protein
MAESADLKEPLNNNDIVRLTRLMVLQSNPENTSALQMLATFAHKTGWRAGFLWGSALSFAIALGAYRWL